MLKRLEKCFSWDLGRTCGAGCACGLAAPGGLPCGGRLSGKTLARVAWRFVLFSLDGVGSGGLGWAGLWTVFLLKQLLGLLPNT
jgi:hypothetical protein